MGGMMGVSFTDSEDGARGVEGKGSVVGWSVAF